MSKTKFTPGPWEMEQSGKRGAWVKGVNGEWSALACGNTDASATNNAYLIAAAPDLYAALEGVVADLFYQLEARHGAQAASEYPTVVAARAALARARGEA